MVGLKVGDAQVLVMGADTSGVLLCGAAWKAADTDLPDQSPVAFPSRVGELLLAPQEQIAPIWGCSAATLLYLVSPGEYFGGMFSHSQCCAASPLGFCFRMISCFGPDPELCCAAVEWSTQ